MRYTDIWIVESLIEAKNNAKSIEDNLDDISTIVHNNPEIENDILVSMKELLLQQIGYFQKENNYFIYGFFKIQK